MGKVVVELVKYDTEKTFKRKRKDLIVDSKDEASVIAKLERIHKGDKIKVIHEIIWDEQAPVEEYEAEKLTGIVKFYEQEKGFGFIRPDEDMDDFFFHSSALDGAILHQDELVEFEPSVGPKGPIAIRIKSLD
jgi:CspA family cold shock protein